MQILIADDDVTSRMVLAGVLKKGGYDVLETASGAAAWNAMREPEAPLMAIIDWMMPEMDGLEVVHRVRSLQTDNPPYLIMLTAKSEKGDIIAGLNAGANDYLAKPFDPGELIARVGVGKRMVEMQKELIAARNALLREATHDSLTGLLNRRAIFEALLRELQRKTRCRFGLGVGMFDIDHFKRVNDRHGHMVGDEVLRGFAEILKTSLRGFDLIGRYGGEEFLVITPGSTSDGTDLYERLRTKIAETPISTQAGDITITTSIGVVYPPDVEITPDALVAAADKALYRAKESGRNRVCHATFK